MNFTALKFEPHTILKAYEVLFGELPAGPVLFLDRQCLKNQWEACARRLSRSEGLPGWQSVVQREDTLDFEELDWAYRSLVELLGGRDQAIVSSWACESIEAVNAVLKKSRGMNPHPRVKRSTSEHRVPSRPAPMSHRSFLASASVSPVAPAPESAQAMELPRVSVDAPGPRRRLMFGRFLLARGHITLQQLIDAVRWQRAQRPPVGRIAMNWGILSANQVYEVLSDKNPEDRFCDVAVRKGFMTGFQRLAVLGRQREMQKPIGAYFVEQGILTQDEIEGLAVEAQAQ